MRQGELDLQQLFVTKDMLKRDMAYSNDEQQIRDILAAEIADNVKKGWEASVK